MVMKLPAILDNCCVYWVDIMCNYCRFETAGIKEIDIIEISNITIAHLIFIGMLMIKIKK